MDDDRLQEWAEMTIDSWLFRGYNNLLSEYEDKRDRAEILDENKELNELVELLLQLVNKLTHQVYILENKVTKLESIDRDSAG
jgi:predicted nuclease with TOPRIM domain